MQTQEIRVHMLPALICPEELARGVCVVIDVLRATTTITAALAAGAREVVPCLEVADALARQAELRVNLPVEQIALGGERGGRKIDGFDFGNSPSEYTPESVGGKTLIFTTSNGTRAMLHAWQADEAWLAAFVNLQSVVELCTKHKRIDILCAGTGGKITREDVLLAGAIVDGLKPADACRVNDQAALARDAWQQACGSAAESSPTSEKLRIALQATQGGRNLTGIGLEADIDDAAAIDRYRIVPRFNAETGRVVAAPLAKADKR